jgi:arylsulfatase
MSYCCRKPHRISRRSFLKAAGAGIAAATWGGVARAKSLLAAESSAKKPNFIIFFTDDQGYNDVGCFGSPFIRTPNFDRMAKEGMKFTSFYAQPVCGPSRAALMTGCYPIRVAEPGNKKNQHTVLHPKEITVAEMLKSAGYATALIGKWHLAGGRKDEYDPSLMPNGQGFDYYFGTPLHNGFTRTVEHKSFKTQLMRNGQILTDALDQEGMDSLTATYTQEAVKFIRDSKESPFFLYLAHNMPHVPLGASGRFRGRSRRGLYGDVIEELDFSAGQILNTLKELNLDDNTLIVFTSDNGPWIEGYLGDYGGSASPLRGWKMSAWEGGPRVPCIMRWPGRIPANKICHEMVTTMDLLPTFAKLAGADLPDNRVIDGKYIFSLMSAQPGAKSPHEAFYFYNYLRLNAVRSGKWKLALPRPANPPGTGWSGRMIDAVEEVQLYDLEADIEERYDLAAKRPEIVARLMMMVERARQDLGDHEMVGRGARFFDGPRPVSRS